MKNRQHAFSLVEVVLALGVISFAIVAILGLVPIGLQTSHSSQDETRAAQIAQTIFASMAAQAPQNFQTIALPTTSPSPAPVLDLSSSTTSASLPAGILYANNDGKIISGVVGASPQVPSGATYVATIITNSAPSGLDPSYVNQVTVSVAWPAIAAPTNQTKREYVRLISKY